MGKFKVKAGSAKRAAGSGHAGDQRMQLSQQRLQSARHEQDRLALMQAGGEAEQSRAQALAQFSAHMAMRTQADRQRAAASATSHAPARASQRASSPQSSPKSLPVQSRVAGDVSRAVLRKLGCDPGRPLGRSNPAPDMDVVHFAATMGTWVHLQQLANGLKYDPKGIATVTLREVKPFAEALTRVAHARAMQKAGKVLHGAALAQASAPFKRQLLDPRVPANRAVFTYFVNNKRSLPAGLLALAKPAGRRP